MPIVKIFYQDLEKQSKLESLVPALKEYIADELTCGEIRLKSDEVSIRLMTISGGGMIGSVEVEIIAHAFVDRINKQDEICLRVAEYLQNKEPLLGKVSVWLQLSELGHSWKNQS